MGSKRNWYAELMTRAEVAGHHLDFEELCRVARKIDWCYRFKHITTGQKDELCNTVIEYFDACKVCG